MINSKIYKVTYRKENDSIIRPIIDNYRASNLLGTAKGEGLMWSGIRYENQENDYYTVKFLARGSLNIKLCEESLHRLEELNLVKIEES